MTAPRRKNDPTPAHRLVAAMTLCAVARGEAQWTNGYRAAGGSAEEKRLYAKEVGQWKAVDRTDAAFRRLAARLLRAERKRGAP
jgi:hypothetical protein